MAHSVKRRKKRTQEIPKAESPSGKKPSKLRLLLIVLAVSILSGILLSRLNTTEVTTEESPESLRLKQEMLQQFMQKQEGLQGEAETVPQ